MLNIELRLASLYLVTLLAYTFIRNVVALLLVLFLLIPDLKMPIDKGGGEFVLGNGRGQKL